MSIITVEQAEHLCSILHAMAEGKTIECSNDDGKTWYIKTSGSVYSTSLYRIKKEPVLMHYRNYLTTWEGVGCVSYRSDDSESTKIIAQNKPTTSVGLFVKWIGDWQSIELEE